jgi:hypothetical protein
MRRCTASDGTTIITRLLCETLVPQWRMAGTTAKKKRQRDDGSNYYEEFARPEALELHCAGCGKIDQHDRFRQC